jgi:hypothetical protein
MWLQNKTCACLPAWWIPETGGHSTAQQAEDTAGLVIRTLKNALVWWYLYTRFISTLQGPFKYIWNICTK